MDKTRFTLTATWLAELLSNPKFNFNKFMTYVKKLQQSSQQSTYEYPSAQEVQDKEDMYNIKVGSNPYYFIITRVVTTQSLIKYTEVKEDVNNKHNKL